jgi:peptidoglycan/LPS O-acetylase OafA/YrhL
LTVEECFYAAAPFLFFLNKTRHYFWRCVLGLYGLVLLLYWCTPVHYRLFETLHFTTYYTFFGRCFDFFAGFGLYLLFHKNKIRLVEGWHTFLGLCGIMVVWLLFGYFHYNHIEVPPMAVFVLQNHILPITIAILIAGLVIEDTLLSKFLSLSLMQWLGNASYIFYLIHIGLLTRLLAWVDWSIYFVLINIISLLTYWLFEIPVHRYLKGRVMDYFYRLCMTSY